MVDDTVALQYRIALHLSGMVDGPSSPLTTSERLSLLRSYETSWKNLDWNELEHTTLPVPEGNLWELYGNVWAHSRGVDAIYFVQIPSRLRNIPLRQWTIKVDFPLRDFGMDPSQDLLVTIEMTTRCVWLTFGRIKRLRATLYQVPCSAVESGYLHYQLVKSTDWPGTMQPLNTSRLFPTSTGRIRFGSAGTILVYCS